MRILRRKKAEDTRTVERLFARPSRPLSLQEQKQQLWSSLEERVTSTVSKEQLEKLYHIDGLTFRLVNDYIQDIIRPGFYLLGDQELVEECMEWSETVKLKAIMEEVIRDILVTGAGNSWLELGYAENGKDILSLRMINPKTGIDYIRDERTKNVLLDDSFRPVGFVQPRNYLGQEIIWKEKQILVDNRVVWRAKYKGEDGRDRIAHFKLFGLGESFLGQSPLETVYKQAIIRLNLEDNVGEAGFRSGGIIAYVGESGAPPVPPAQIDKLVDALKNVNIQSIFGFQHNVRIERFPTPDIDKRVQLIYYFADIQAAGMGASLAKYLTIEAPSRRALELVNIDYENRIAALQDKLAEQMREKLFYRVLKARGRVSRLKEVPRVVFRSNMPAAQREHSSSISRLARRGLITWDPELEIVLREQYGLPTTFLKKELKKWEKRGRSILLPKNVPEEDIETQLEEYIAEHPREILELLREHLGERE
jgi:hypothetical protein